MSVDADARKAAGTPVDQALLNRGLTDAECIQAVLAGNRQRFEDIVLRYQNAVFAVVRASIKDVHAAEDTAQEVFVMAFSALAELRDPSAFGPWLMQIARRHASLNAQRAQRRKNDMPVEDAQLAAPVPAQDHTAEVFALVEQLPEPYRSTVIDKYQRNLSCKQIADSEGVAVSTITSRLTRALAMLRGGTVRQEEG
jgi:RNA polymerase sigma-70 factor, ECF subfamily